MWKYTVFRAEGPYDVGITEVILNCTKCIIKINTKVS